MKPKKSPTASGRFRRVAEGLYVYEQSGVYYARFRHKGSRVFERLGTDKEPCSSLPEARRLIREKKDTLDKVDRGARKMSLHQAIEAYRAVMKGTKGTKTYKIDYLDKFKKAGTNLIANTGTLYLNAGNAGTYIGAGATNSLNQLINTGTLIVTNGKAITLGGATTNGNGTTNLFANDGGTTILTANLTVGQASTNTLNVVRLGGGTMSVNGTIGTGTLTTASTNVFAWN